MLLKKLEISGFKSFAKKGVLEFTTPITAIVGPNGSGKSNVAEAFRFALGEQSLKSLRGKRGEDLIFNGSLDGGRLNRASVKLTFDNSSKFLPVDFDEVSLERIVHRDSLNEYLINGSPVRLKDITELLASAHIGASGHHIISQGEADRILNANPRERREMIEDALGLKLYQYKKTESERKLEKTKENIEKVESLRRELAPHIRFLKKQVEKVEKARELRGELTVLYQEYLGLETAYLSHQKSFIAAARVGPQKEILELDAELAHAKETLSKSEQARSKTLELASLEQQMRSVDDEKNKLLREAGRISGEVGAIEKLIRREHEARAREDSQTVYLRDVERVSREIHVSIENVAHTTDIDILKKIIVDIAARIRSFVEGHKGIHVSDTTDAYKEDISRLEEERKNVENALVRIEEEYRELKQKTEAIQSSLEKEREGTVEAEKTIFKIMARQNELHAVIRSLRTEENQLHLEEEEYKRELNEAHVLVGREALNYTTDISPEEDRSYQHERRRTIERIKIRLEEIGGGGSEEIMKEFKEAEERDQFLAREIADLEASSASLLSLISDLEAKLDIEFKQGIHKINTAFTLFFQKMFGGGNAAVKVVQEVKRRRRDTDVEAIDEPEEEIEEGIDIDVVHPFKKIKSLMMLSGGERALTSIALLFAISQVNPPPFIILDETDAALDEANSKKYGDMIASLAEYSQLILITHNRETMSRAGVLYGITMASGSSKLLSIKFDEAVAVAK